MNPVYIMVLNQMPKPEGNQLNRSKTRGHLMKFVVTSALVP